MSQDARPSPGAGIRILLAEDSIANQLVATGMLEYAGYRVDVVADGEQAVAAFERGEYDLILMDLRMPHLDGLGATAAIRGQPRGADIPIIAMTANVFKEDREHCLAAGMNDFITKPVTRQHLLDTIARHLRRGAVAGACAADRPNAEEPLLLDMQTIRQMAADVGEQALPAMVEAFLAEIRARAEQLKRDMREAPTDALEDQAHTLKSCAATIGAARLQLLARDIELACRQGNRLAAEALSERMIVVMHETLAAFGAHYATLD